MFEHNPFGFFLALLDNPWWLILWVGWMTVVNLGMMAFWPRRETKVVVSLFLAGVGCMMVLYGINGYTRQLGLGHVIFWTPMVLWLLTRLKIHPWPSRLGRWMRILLVTNIVSLVIDYRDVWLYYSGQ